MQILPADELSQPKVCGSALFAGVDKCFNVSMFPSSAYQQWYRKEHGLNAIPISALPSRPLHTCDDVGPFTDSYNVTSK